MEREKSQEDLIQFQQNQTEVDFQKIDILEETIKRAEALLISVDSTLGEIITGKIQSLISEKESEINEKKKKHQECLVKLKEMYEEFQSQETEIQDKMKIQNAAIMMFKLQETGEEFKKQEEDVNNEGYLDKISEEKSN